MDKKKMMITAGIMAAAGYGTYKYFKNNPAKVNMIKHKIKDAVNTYEDEMMM